MSDDTAREQLARWFTARTITVESLPLADERAYLLGEVTACATASGACRSLLVRLARRMQDRSPYPVHVRREGLSDRETGEVRRLARRLAELGIVARVLEPAKSAVTVFPLVRETVNRKRFAELTTLLGGKWLETHALDVLRRLLTGPAPVGHGVKVRLPAGCQVELDVFALVGDRPVWVECTTGRSYQRKLARFGALSGTLGTGPTRSILAVCGIDAGTARAIGLVHGLTVVAASDLAGALAAAVGT
jgi:hypothetical protein